jgi:hypothetical protein
MNKQISGKMKPGIVFLTIVGLAFGCTTDKDIKADIASKVKSDINFAAVNYSVENKIVTLTGTCPSLKSNQKVEEAIKSIHVIKGLVNNIKISPVVLNADLPLKQGVDSLLADYPTVQAQVRHDTVELYGKAGKQMISKLLPAISQLHPVNVQTKIIQLPEEP